MNTGLFPEHMIEIEKKRELKVKRNVRWMRIHQALLLYFITYNVLCLKLFMVLDEMRKLSTYMHMYIQPEIVFLQKRLLLNLPSLTLTITAARNIPNTKLQTINIIKYGDNNTQVLYVCVVVYALVRFHLFICFYSIFQFTRFLHILWSGCHFFLLLFLLILQHFTIRKEVHQ